jgi:hypothetical protein
MCEWPGCGATFNRKDKLKKHMNGHKKGAPVVTRRVNPSVAFAVNSPPTVGQPPTPHPYDLSHRAGLAGAAGLPFIQPQASVRWPTLQ